MESWFRNEVAQAYALQNSWGFGWFLNLFERFRSKWLNHKTLFVARNSNLESILVTDWFEVTLCLYMTSIFFVSQIPIEGQDLTVQRKYILWFQPTLYQSQWVGHGIIKKWFLRPYIKVTYIISMLLIFYLHVYSNSSVY